MPSQIDEGICSDLGDAAIIGKGLMTVTAMIGGPCTIDGSCGFEPGFPQRRPDQGIDSRVEESRSDRVQFEQVTPHAVRQIDAPEGSPGNQYLFSRLDPVDIERVAPPDGELSHHIRRVLTGELDQGPLCRDQIVGMGSG